MYFVLPIVCCLLLKCKHKQINYIGWGRESWILPLLSITHNFVVSVRRSSSSSGCLGKAAINYFCGTPWVFHLAIQRQKCHVTTDFGMYETGSENVS